MLHVSLLKRETLLFLTAPLLCANVRFLNFNTRNNYRTFPYAQIGPLSTSVFRILPTFDSIYAILLRPYASGFLTWAVTVYARVRHCTCTSIFSLTNVFSDFQHTQYFRTQTLRSSTCQYDLINAFLLWATLG